MSIADWFSARETKRYTRVTESGRVHGLPTCPTASGSSARAASAPSTRASSCSTLRVCPTCGFHFDLTAPQRIELLADEGSFAEIDADLVPCDPLEFTAAKTYADQLEAAAEKSGLPEAVITGTRDDRAHPVVLGAMDFRFIGASMGSVVGEKITRAFELATASVCPSCS